MPPPPPPNLDDDERAVWDVIDDGSLPDAVARGARLSIPDATTVLLRLELRGLIVSEGGRSATSPRPRPVDGGRLRPFIPVDTQGSRPTGSVDERPSSPSRTRPARRVRGPPRAGATLVEQHRRRLSARPHAARHVPRPQPILTGRAPYPLLRRFLAQQHTLGTPARRSPGASERSGRSTDGRASGHVREDPRCCSAGPRW